MAANWNQIREEYISCNDTQSEFAKRHPEISISTLKKKCAKENWEELRNQFRTQKEQLVRKANMQKAVRKETTVQDLWDKLAKKTMASLNSQQGIIPSSSLEHYANTIEKLQKGLGVRDQLDVDEQKARIAKLRRDTEKPEDEKPGGIIFEFPPELEEDAP